MQENLMVTIRCMAYNHEPYIRQCLEGFILQKTNFRFEAIVHDDASTDGTVSIIKEYAEKYPDIIKPIYEIENQYSKRDGSLTRIMDSHMHGKYIAICEGDDYWTDPYKLQDQVDFLESHPNFSMCFHAAKIEKSDKYNPNDKFRLTLYQNLEERSYTDVEIFKNWCIPTASVLYRRIVPIVKDKRFIVGDNPLFLSCAKYGQIYCISKDPKSVYRLVETGAVARGFQWEKQINHFKAILEHFGGSKEMNQSVREKILLIYTGAFLEGKFKKQSWLVLYVLVIHDLNLIFQFTCIILNRILNRMFK